MTVGKSGPSMPSPGVSAYDQAVKLIIAVGGAEDAKKRMEELLKARKEVDEAYTRLTEARMEGEKAAGDAARKMIDVVEECEKLGKERSRLELLSEEIGKASMDLDERIKETNRLDSNSTRMLADVEQRAAQIRNMTKAANAKLAAAKQLQTRAEGMMADAEALKESLRTKAAETAKVFS